ncbi:ABC transporter permease [Nonomuraea typhae]|uniref:ABC transporter permease n=1 Tax=Nonomuraea typhae TaxID=2603600 RepID=UPI0012F8C807|nr:ABC transporter permease [Nonomuraea typhae]
MRRAVAAEWAKLWSVRSTWWCLAGAVTLMVLASVTVGGALGSQNGQPRTEALPATEPVVAASIFAQFALVALAMLVVTAEYSSGGMRVTVQAVPVRGRVLAAKALVVAPVLFVAGVVSGAVGAVLTSLLLGLDAFGVPVTLNAGETVADLVRLGVFFALAGVLTVGAGTALRSAAGTLTVVFMLMLGLPLLIMMTGSAALIEASMRLPLFAGLAFMDSAENLTGGPMPYPWGEGLAWLLGWTAAALVAGYVVLRRRDA